MKKQLHILKGLFILTLIFILSLCLVTFTYKILHENVDTTYMWNINLTNLKIKEGSKKGNISIKDNKVTLDLTLKEENDFIIIGIVMLIILYFWHHENFI